MNIEQEESNGNGAFYVEEKGHRLAEMVYNLPKQGVMVISHTEVDDALRGKNVGSELINRGVEYARTHHLKIIPTCPFVKSVFEKTDEYNDVWK